MKKQLLKTSLTALMVVGMCLGITGCATNNNSEQSDAQESSPAQTEEIKTSPDKHT